MDVPSRELWVRGLLCGSGTAGCTAQEREVVARMTNVGRVSPNGGVAERIQTRLHKTCRQPPLSNRRDGRNVGRMRSYPIPHPGHDSSRFRSRRHQLSSLFMNIPFYVALTRVTGKGFPPLRGPPDVCMCCIIGCSAAGVQAGGPSDSEESGFLPASLASGDPYLGKPLDASLSDPWRRLRDKGMLRDRSRHSRTVPSPPEGIRNPTSTWRWLRPIRSIGFLQADKRNDLHMITRPVSSLLPPSPSPSPAGAHIDGGVT